MEVDFEKLLVQLADVLQKNEERGSLGGNDKLIRELRERGEYWRIHNYPKKIIVIKKALFGGNVNLELKITKNKHDNYN